MDPAKPSRWGRCEIVTMKFGRHYYLIMETVCPICFQKLLSVRISYNLSIMLLVLATSIELRAYDINQI
jgi:hypothetical protein